MARRAHEHARTMTPSTMAEHYVGVYRELSGEPQG
jgi:hypothetical protein